MYTVIRQMPPEAQIVQKLVARCRISLANLSPIELWSDFPPEFLLWVLVVVGSASVSEWERIWVGRLLMELRDRMQLGSWDDVKTILEEYVWVESRCAKPCKAFWDESTALGSVSVVLGSESESLHKTQAI